jgi:hypothetical protein
MFKKRQKNAQQMSWSMMGKFGSHRRLLGTVSAQLFISSRSKKSLRGSKNDHDQTHQTAIHPPKTIAKTSVRFGCDVCGVVCVLEWFEAPLSYL